MADRRRSPRYVFYAPADARARMLHEAVVERWDGDTAIVVTPHAAVRGDECLLRFVSPSGELATRIARVISTAPDTTDALTRYRLTLAVSSTTPDSLVDTVPGF